MRRYYAFVAVLVLAVVLTAALAAAAAQQRQQTAIGSIVITSNLLEGSLQGPWTASKGVTVTAGGTTITADTVKIWPRKGGRTIQRAEASGSLHITGTYAMAQAGGEKTDWKMNATAQSGSFDGDTQTGVLSGKVELRATNASTGEVVTAQADKAVYNGKTQRFRFERSGQPVHVQWQEAPGKSGPAK